MLDQQSKLSRVQEQVATGKKITKPSEDPVAAAKVVKLNDILKTAEQYQANINAARSQLTLEEGALADTVSVYHRIRELTIQANNAGQTNETRGYIAEEMQQLLEELVALANATDSNGDFLFSGNKGKFKPFAKNANGGFDYHGDDGQRFIQIGPGRTIAINDSGSDVFREVRDGNGAFAIFEAKHNRGTGVVDPGAVSGEYDFGTYAIIFDREQSVNPNEPLTYSVVDDKGSVIVPPGQIFNEGNAIEFAGVNTFIKGRPDPGDYFVIRPSYHQDIFKTIHDFSLALKEGRSTDPDFAKLNNHANRILVAMDTIFLSSKSTIPSGSFLESLTARFFKLSAINFSISRTVFGSVQTFMICCMSFVFIWPK